MIRLQRFTTHLIDSECVFFCHCLSVAQSLSVCLHSMKIKSDFTPLLMHFNALYMLVIVLFVCVCSIKTKVKTNHIIVTLYLIPNVYAERIVYIHMISITVTLVFLLFCIEYTIE